MTLLLLLLFRNINSKDILPVSYQKCILRIGKLVLLFIFSFDLFHYRSKIIREGQMIIALKTIQIKILARMEIGYHICHINRISDLCCCGVISICDLCILVIFRAAIIFFVIFFVVFFVITVVLVDSCKLGFCLSQDLIIRNLGLFCIRRCLMSAARTLFISALSAAVIVLPASALIFRITACTFAESSLAGVLPSVQVLRLAPALPLVQVLLSGSVLPLVQVSLSAPVFHPGAECCSWLSVSVPARVSVYLLAPAL